MLFITLGLINNCVGVFMQQLATLANLYVLGHVTT